MSESPEEKERLNRLYKKAFEKMATYPKGSPIHYASLRDLDIQECPLCGEVFFGLTDIASHTVKAHKMSISEVRKLAREKKGMEEWNPTKR